METGLKIGIMNREEYYALHSKELNIEPRTLSFMYRAYEVGYLHAKSDIEKQLTNLIRQNQ